MHTIMPLQILTHSNLHTKIHIQGYKQERGEKKQCEDNINLNHHSEQITKGTLTWN